MFAQQLFWDGRVGSLEDQAKQPLTNPFEMGMDNYAAVVARDSHSEYQQRFQPGEQSIILTTLAGVYGTWSPLVDGVGSTLALTDSTGTVQTQYTYEGKRERV